MSGCSLGIEHLNAGGTIAALGGTPMLRRIDRALVELRAA
jgi:hypothetical protein